MICQWHEKSLPYLYVIIVQLRKTNWKLWLLQNEMPPLENYSIVQCGYYASESLIVMLFVTIR